MKVLHMISSGGMYGAEAVILNLARTLRGGPHECVMGVFSNSANPQIQLHEIALKEGFESHLVPVQGAGGPRGDCRDSGVGNSHRRGCGPRSRLQGRHLYVPCAARDGRAAGLDLPHLV